MKIKTTIFTIVLLSCALALPAGIQIEKKKPAVRTAPPMTFTVLVRASYMLPTEQAFKDVYGSSLMSLGGELRLNFGPVVSLWAEGSYLNKSGSLTYTQEPTTLTIIPIEAGLLFRLARGPFTPYFGAGSGYFMYKESNAIGTVDYKPFGFCGIAGASYSLGSLLLIDARFKYQYCTVATPDASINIGGIHLSIGIGIVF